VFQSTLKNSNTSVKNVVIDGQSRPIHGYFMNLKTILTILKITLCFAKIVVMNLEIVLNLTCLENHVRDVKCTGTRQADVIAWIVQNVKLITVTYVGLKDMTCTVDANANVSACATN
jgi:hypothetical protein